MKNIQTPHFTISPYIYYYFITFAKCNLLCSFFCEICRFSDSSNLFFSLFVFSAISMKIKKWKEFSFVMLLEAAFMGHPEVFCISSKHGGRKRKSKTRFYSFQLKSEVCVNFNVKKVQKTPVLDSSLYSFTQGVFSYQI